MSDFFTNEQHEQDTREALTLFAIAHPEKAAAEIIALREIREEARALVQTSVRFQDNTISARERGRLQIEQRARIVRLLELLEPSDTSKFK